MRGRWIRQPSDDGVALVFIHGVLSDESCWLHENGTFWPDVLAKERSVATAGIYVFEYNTGFFSGTYRLGDVVDALRTQLRLDKVSDCQTLAFVCHSMGGIVARRYIVQNELELVENDKLVGLFLIASPSLGSNYANWLSPIAKWFKHTQADALRFSQTNAWLLDLDKDFMNLKERGKLRLVGKELVEDRFITLRRFFLEQVVPPFSGARYFGDAYKVPASDHFSIAKISSASETQHRLLVEFLEPMVAPLLDDHSIKIRFSDEIHPDLVSCTLAVKRLAQTDDPVRIEWPAETIYFVKTLNDLAAMIENHFEPESPFRGLDQKTIADFAGSVKRQLERVEIIQTGVPDGARRLIRGMEGYWTLGFENTLARSLHNFLTLCNADIISNTIYLFSLKVLYEDFYPKKYDWFIPIRSREVHGKLLGIDEKLASAKLSSLSGTPFEQGAYFWGPQSELIKSAQWRKGQAITTTWFDKFLIPQNELDQILSGEKTQFNYDETMDIIKVLDEDGQEIA